MISQYKNQYEEAYPIATSGQFGAQNFESVIEQIALPPHFYIERKIEAVGLISKNLQTQNE